MTDADWNLLLEHIRERACTPFLGAGASVPEVEKAADIASNWARASGYPLEDTNNLARVTQFMALNLDGHLLDRSIPKRRMVSYLKGRPRPAYDRVDSFYRTMADLQVPVYITTNYDPFLTEAIRTSVPGRAPRSAHRDFCRWNRRLGEKHPPDRGFVPTLEEPLVFHLHGHTEIVESLVLTDDDYTDFMVNLSEQRSLIPAVVQDALTDNMLLFLGYSLSDWNVRVVFRLMQSFLQNSTRGGHVAVQIPLEMNILDRERARRFAERSFEDQNIVIFWGTCDEFATELRKRLSGGER